MIQRPGPRLTGGDACATLRIPALRVLPLAPCVSPLLLATAALAVSARGEIDFAREVRPIFSEHCFACHGPDAAKRKSGLRLDEKESAFGKAESGEITIVRATWRRASWCAASRRLTRTTGATWFGLTLACAQCHDHKFDPVTQRDFYQLYAFFHNVPENGKDGVRDRNPHPFLLVPSPEQQQLDKLAAEVAAAQKAEAELAKTLDARQAEWEKTVAASGRVAEPGGPFTVFPLDDSLNGRDDQGRAVPGKLNGAESFVEGAVGQSLRTEAKGYVDAGEVFGFERDKAFSAGAWLRLKPAGGSPSTAAR